MIDPRLIACASLSGDVSVACAASEICGERYRQHRRREKFEIDIQRIIATYGLLAMQSAEKGCCGAVKIGNTRKRRIMALNCRLTGSGRIAFSIADRAVGLPCSAAVMHELQACSGGDGHGKRERNFF